MATLGKMFSDFEETTTTHEKGKMFLVGYRVDELDNTNVRVDVNELVDYEKIRVPKVLEGLSDEATFAKNGYQKMGDVWVFDVHRCGGYFQISRVETSMTNKEYLTMASGEKVLFNVLDVSFTGAHFGWFTKMYLPNFGETAPNEPFALRLWGMDCGFTIKPRLVSQNKPTVAFLYNPATDGENPKAQDWFVRFVSLASAQAPCGVNTRVVEAVNIFGEDEPLV